MKLSRNISKFAASIMMACCMGTATIVEATAPGDSHNHRHNFRFGYLFPQLEPLNLDNEILLLIGKPSDDTANPAYMEDSQFRGTDNNAEQVVGMTYFGQILIHDISLDSDSQLGAINFAPKVRNRATPWLDLDTIYNHDGTRALRDPNDRAKLLLGNDLGNERDFPRDEEGHALIADRRNDENNNIAQLTPVLMAFHNSMVDLLRSQGVSERWLFFKARRLTVLHWQAAILHEFLPEFVEQSLIDDILLNGPKYYKGRMARKGRIPVEFSVAAARFGHSTARGRYTLNEDFDRMRLFPLSEAELERNLLGDKAVPPEQQIEWNRFFNFSNSIQGDLGDDVDQFLGLQVGRKIDRFLARPMLRLPIGGPGLPEFILDTENQVAGMPVVSLGTLSLLRGKAMGLPSGQAVAVAMGNTPLSNAELGLCNPGEPCAFGDLPLPTAIDEAPLFLYLMEEARIQKQGETLGDTGGRILAEVILGLLKNDRRSILNKPFVSPITNTSEFTIEDMIIQIGWIDLEQE